MAPLSRSFRLVCRPEQIPLVEGLLEAEGFRFEPEPFSLWCRQLVSGPFALGSSLAAFFGYIYIQDRSSMLPPLALDPPEGSKVLDMAASPGSKTGFLAQICGESGFILANEPNPSRLATLRANLQLCNLLQTGTCSYPGEKLPLPEGGWQYILLDPPCSGWGTTAKNPSAPKIWQGSKIKRLIALQKALLRKASALLAPGGTLLYSTCTTNPDENQAQTAFATESLGLEAVPLRPFPGFVMEATSEGALLVNGEASRSQGFYLSRLRKPGAETQAVDAPPSPVPDCLPRATLDGPVFDAKLLPPGCVCEFGKKVRFLPEQARFPASFHWQGPALGKFSGLRFSPEPGLRSLLPEPAQFPNAPHVTLETCAEARKLIAGSEVTSSLADGPAGLWLKDLPLAICQIKNGRIIPRFR